MKDYRKICALLESKKIEDCVITKNKLGYTPERLQLNASLLYMKSTMIGPEDLFEDQMWILGNCFGDKGEKTPLGTVLFSYDFCSALTPAATRRMGEGCLMFRDIYMNYIQKFVNEDVTNEELFNATKRYFKIKGKYLMALVSRLHPPQVMCLRNAFFNREENFNKKACIMKHPEYNTDEDPLIQKELDDLLDTIEYEGEVTSDLLDGLEEKKMMSVAQMDKIQAVCR